MQFDSIAPHGYSLNDVRIDHFAVTGTGNGTNSSLGQGSARYLL